MAGSVNKVILVGNLGRDPEVRRLGSGEPVVSFRLATSESWKDKNSGERKEKTEWHSVVIFNENLAKVAESYLKKGYEGLSGGPASDPQMAGSGWPGEIHDGDRASAFSRRIDNSRRTIERRRAPIKGTTTKGSGRATVNSGARRPCSGGRCQSRKKAAGGCLPVQPDRRRHPVLAAWFAWTCLIAGRALTSRHPSRPRPSMKLSERRVSPNQFTRLTLTNPASMTSFSSPLCVAWARPRGTVMTTRSPSVSRISAVRPILSRPMRGCRIAAGSDVGRLMLSQCPSIAHSSRDCHSDEISLASQTLSDRSNRRILDLGEPDRRHAPEGGLAGDSQGSRIGEILGDVAPVVDAGENQIGFAICGEQPRHRRDDAVRRRSGTGIPTGADTAHGQRFRDGQRRTCGSPLRIGSNNPARHR